VRLASVQQEQLLARTQQFLGVVARLPQVRGRNHAACSAFLAGVLKENPRYANLGTILPNGEVFCSALPFTPR